MATSDNLPHLVSDAPLAGLSCTIACGMPGLIRLTADYLEAAGARCAPHAPLMECHVCGVPVPHGNLKNYAQQLAQEWGDDTMYIAVTLDHVWNTPQPPGTARTLVEKRLANAKNSRWSTDKSDI